jgi:hypothetical protein
MYTPKRVDEGTHHVTIDVDTSVVSPDNHEGKSRKDRTRSKRSVMPPKTGIAEYPVFRVFTQVSSSDLCPRMPMISRMSTEED